MHLFLRFWLTDEDFDFTNNKKWFHVKTAVAVGGKSNFNTEEHSVTRKRSMAASSFSAQMKAAFRANNFDPSHVVHFGRITLPALCEMAEVMQELIKDIGNWERSVHNKSYSTSMAWQALRVAAGFEKERGRCHLPRH